MLKTITLEQATSNVEQGLHACQQLLILLEDERTALKERDTEALTRIIKDKSNSLLALEQSAKQRTAWLQANAADTELEHAWAEHVNALSPELGSQWLQFKSLLEDCRAHNEINGKMLARNQQVFKRIVSLVRGQTDQQPLYTPKGSRGSAKGYHNLGEA